MLYGGVQRGQTQYAAILIVAILTMFHSGFLFFLRLAELTLFFLAACRSLHVAALSTHVDISALLAIGHINQTQPLQDP